LALGQVNEPVLGVPVDMGRIGISLVGGLVPAAAMKELGAGIETFAPHCLMPIQDMMSLA